MGPQPGQRQRWVLAGQQHEVDEGRSLLDQEADKTMHRLSGDQLVVIEGKHERVVALRQRLDERRADELRARGRPGTEEVRGRVGGRRSDRSQRPGEVAGEAGEIVVCSIEREPGVGELARLEPADDSDRLSVARWGRQQGQAGAVLESSIEQCAEARTLAMARGCGRRPELR